MAKDPSKLTDEQKRFIVGGFARWETPTQIALAVKERYGLELKRQVVAHYDPEHSQDLAPKWRELHAAIRKAFLEEETEIAIANRAFRLQEILRIARQSKNPAVILQALEQAAKEMGNAFSNRRELTGADGKDLAAGVLVVPQPVSDEAWSTAAAASQAKLPGSGHAGSGEK